MQSPLYFPVFLLKIKIDYFSFYCKSSGLQIYIDKNIDSSNEISYCTGDVYKNPVSAEFYFHGDAGAETGYENQEMEYIGVNWNLKNVQLYECRNLGINIVLDSMESDGVATWRNGDVGGLHDVCHVFCL